MSLSRQLSRHDNWEEPKYKWHCLDVTAENDPTCYGHIQWAIEAGEQMHPDWYPEGSTGSVQDVQCALYLKVGGHVSENSHNCSLPPCEAISTSMANSTDTDVKFCSAPPVPLAAAPSMEWWGWLLIVAALVGVGLLIAYALGLFTKKAAKKKKRAIKALVDPEPVQTTPVPVPTYEIAPPIYTYSAAPIYEATQSIAVSAPSVITASPMYATYAQPMYMAEAPIIQAADGGMVLMDEYAPPQ